LLLFFKKEGLAYFLNIARQASPANLARSPGERAAYRAFGASIATGVPGGNAAMKSASHNSPSPG
jgi:hypothetical protein